MRPYVHDYALVRSVERKHGDGRTVILPETFVKIVEIIGRDDGSVQYTAKYPDGSKWYIFLDDICDVVGDGK